jgi:hypothetical protein
MLIQGRISNCHQHSYECWRRAGRATDPSLKRDYLELQGVWLALARGYASADLETDHLLNAPGSTEA